MNTEVSATNMQVQAVSEGGILITQTKTDDNSWLNTTAFASIADDLKVKPVSTKDGSTWYHGTSNSDVKSSEGAVYTPVESANYDDYFIKNTVYIKSATAGAERGGLKVKSITVTGATASGAYNSALRVLVKSGESVKIFAPVALATGDAQKNQDSTKAHLSYNVNGTLATTAIDASNPETFTSTELLPVSTKIDSVNANATQVDIYLYYEGEDAGCISAHSVPTFDKLAVSVAFEAIDAYTGE